ncbi:MAG: DegT/DnrJ/EryC1/StrS family aminotransferase [Phycisphaerae bacterium]
MRSVPMLDLGTEYKLFEDEVRSAVHTVLESQHFIGGPSVTELERRLAEMMEVPHAVAVSNGSDALLCALMAMEVGPGDEVVVPSFTFFATAGSVARTGATPVFADVDEKTFNVTPETLERVITPKTKVIVPVHLYGQCADMPAIMAVAERHGAMVLEDAAQAFGAAIGGKKAGSFGQLSTLSFYPTKNLGGFGEGGMIFGGDAKLVERCLQLRNHGQTQRYIHEFVGGNFRLDTMKASILLVKTRYVEEFTRRRMYAERLAGAAVQTPEVPDNRLHVFHQYTIKVDRRDELQAFLTDRGVGSTIYYPRPLHLQPCFSHLGYSEGDLPVSERLSHNVLSIPCHPMLSDDDIDYVASCIREFTG